MGVSKNRGTPKSSILIGFSIINHPFWGTSIFGNTHIQGYRVNHPLGQPYNPVHVQLSFSIAKKKTSLHLCEIFSKRSQSLTDSNPSPSLWGITNSNLIYPPLKTNIHSQKLTKTNVFVPENRPLQKEIHLPVAIDLPIFQAMSC